MADFDIALKRTGMFEWGGRPDGDFSNDPDDPGGGTCWGIAEATARQDGYNGDMKKLPYERAQRIYRRNYWIPIQGDWILYQTIANHVFDCGVNMGTGTAIRMLQTCLNDLFDLGLVRDGVCGKKTLDSMNSMNAANMKALLDSFLEARKSRYETLIINNPNLEKFRAGWMKRCVA